jgi:hypothetical protein
MSRTICLGVAFAALALTGCSASRTAETRTVIAPGAYGPVTPHRMNGSDVFFLGAGDALGQDVFTQYVASLGIDLDQYYATGQSDFAGE